MVVVVVVVMMTMMMMAEEEKEEREENSHPFSSLRQQQHIESLSLHFCLCFMMRPLRNSILYCLIVFVQVIGKWNSNYVLLQTQIYATAVDI